jgi:hypothetical protein
VPATRLPVLVLLLLLLIISSSSGTSAAAATLTIETAVTAVVQPQAVCTLSQQCERC